MNNFRNSVKEFIPAMVLIVLLISTAEGHSVSPFGLVQKTRRSELVVIGAIADVRPNILIVKVGKVLKGTPPSNSIEVDLKDIPTVDYKLGDSVAIFGIKKGSRFTSFVGEQGSLKIEGGSSAEYEAAIKSIIEYDAATSEKKGGRLRAMLGGNNPVLQHAALWDLVYPDQMKRKRDGPAEDLLPDLEKLAKGSDAKVASLATEIIGHTRSMKSIPILIDLVGTGSPAASDAASRALNGKVRKAEKIELGGSPGGRAKAMREWNDWWKKNKDKSK